MLSNTLKQENAHIILNVKLGHVLLNEENSPDVTRIKTAGWFAHLAMVDGKLNEFTHPKIWQKKTNQLGRSCQRSKLVQRSQFQ